jgi:hypothetical protein
VITCWQPGQERQALQINEERAMRGLRRLPSCAELAEQVEVDAARRRRREQLVVVGGLTFAATVLVVTVSSRLREDG